MLIETLLGLILLLLFAIFVTLCSIFAFLKREFDPRNSGLLACLYEMNLAISGFVGRGHLGHPGAEEWEVSHIIDRLDSINGLLTEIDTTTAPFRHVNHPNNLNADL